MTERETYTSAEIALLPRKDGGANPPPANSAPIQLSTVSMNDLYENVYMKSPPLIDGLLYTGVYLFVGAPKLGKSFFMAQLAYHISTGKPLWDYPVRQSTVLYLALEDDHRRLQERLYRMFGTECADNLYFAVSSNSLDNGLNEQLTGFIKAHSDTRLIIIDTLQKIRDAGGDNYSYANDYEVIAQLKQFADKYGVCLIIVHHTRKQRSEDKFDMISGTNGLLGAADGAFLLTKESRTANTATLEVSGRDQQDQKLHLVRDMDKLSWQLESTETQLWKAPPDPLLEKVAALVTPDAPEWSGSPSELVSVVDTDMAANALTRYLNVNSARLRSDYNIEYGRRLRHEGRRIYLRLLSAGDAAPT